MAEIYSLSHNVRANLEAAKAVRQQAEIASKTDTKRAGQYGVEAMRLTQRALAQAKRVDITS